MDQKMAAQAVLHDALWRDYKRQRDELEVTVAGLRVQVAAQSDRIADLTKQLAAVTAEKVNADPPPAAAPAPARKKKGT